MSIVPDDAPASLDSNDGLALASRIAAGDRSALELLMRRYNRRLYKLARATLRDAAEAEDALQDAYLLAYRKIAQFNGESSLSTWLSRLVLNECYGRMRKEKRRQEIVPTVSADALGEYEVNAVNDTAAEPDQSLARAQIRALLEHRLDQLPEEFRTVFVMRSVEEMSVEETAQCLGIAQATVRSRHFRARSLLRASLYETLGRLEHDIFDFGGRACDRIVASVLARLSPDA
jgi:RNA polymerase sigma factor (sigma-70 family)